MASLKNLIKIGLPLIDIVVAPAVFVAAFLMKGIRQAGIRRMPACKRVLMKVGVFPIRNHYYEPLFDTSLLRRPLHQTRDLPGIDWNADEQLHLLKSFCFSAELNGVAETRVDDLTFHLNNGAFERGDAEYLYNLIRLKKPARLIEIGSGHSTLIAISAIRMNQEEMPGYECKHVCIEPYEMPWLEKTGVTVIRQTVEEVHKALFLELGKDDILFIDSSHIIRPQGDVLFEYLELIPSLKAGVIVHAHDIFSPRDYLKEWVIDDVRFWNEQYLMEAFLTCNRDWKVIGALNYLHRYHYRELKSVCPFLTPETEPGSFYIQKVA